MELSNVLNERKAELDRY